MSRNSFRNSFYFCSLKSPYLLSAQKKILLIALLVTMVSYNPGASDEDPGLTNKLMLDNVRLTNSVSEGEEFRDVEKYLESFMRKWEIRGASLAVAKDGKLIYARGFGQADTTTREEVQPFYKFRVASISKLVTAVAVMKLAEKGRLSLNDRVFGENGILDDDYFSNPKDKRTCDITVAHLLSHEAGWSQRWGDQMFMPVVIADHMGTDMPVDTRTIIRFALDKRLHFSPGTGRAYSNLGYAILGLVIEKISGMPYDEYCKKSILEPLGIYDMMLARNLKEEKAAYEVTYHVPADVLPKPSVYGTGKLLSPCYGGNDIEALGAAGAWLATAPDLMRLLLAVDGFDTRPDILSERSIELMTDNSRGLAPAGWKTTMDNGTWWRTGSFPGTAAMMKREADGTAWVVLLNSSTWNGPEIHSYINSLMQNVTSKLKTVENTDLFNFSVPVPLTSADGNELFIR